MVLGGVKSIVDGFKGTEGRMKVCPWPKEKVVLMGLEEKTEE